MKSKFALGAALSASLLMSGATAAFAGPAMAPDLSKSLVPGYPDVVAEYLQIPGFKAPGTPDPLNTASFLRLRASADGDHPKPANAVIIAMPGFSSTPPHWLWLASQLVHKANAETCDDGQPCRVEVWVIQRRGANLADTVGLRQARAAHDPKPALDYYYGSNAVTADPARGGANTVLKAPGEGDAKWRVLSEHDLGFMADWGFETYAGDADRMIALIKQKSGAHNIFLAGHSQGGSFVSDYAGRMQADGKRGLDKLSGLIYLDAQTMPGQPGSPTAADLKAYTDHVDALRAGKAPVYTGGGGLLGNLAGPIGAAQAEVVFTYLNLADLGGEAIFAPIPKPTAPKAGEAFRYALRMNWLAFAGSSFDVDPLPGSDIQLPPLRFLGEGLGHLDFRPVNGTESLCDLAPAASMMMMGPPPKPDPRAPFSCVASTAMIDPAKVYGWLEGGGDGVVPGKVGKAALWAASAGFAPARSNIKPVTVTLADNGPTTIDASNLVGSNFYPSERHDFDASWFGKWAVIKLTVDGMSVDLDKTGLNLPVYVARRSISQKGDNPFPNATDFTEINRTGTYQSAPAKAVSPIDPKINVALYNHTDIVSADDSLAGKVRPGEPGASAVSDTLVDWVLKRSKGRAEVPTPKQLGVIETY